MIHATPPSTKTLRSSLDRLDRLREKLAHEVGQSQPWNRMMVRNARVDAVVSSTVIEGYRVSPEQADRLVADNAPPGGDVSQQAVAGYARAMHHVAVMASDPGFSWSDRVLLDLHFDACSFQLDKQPGRWRTRPVYVLDANGDAEYTGPEHDRVPGLMHETASWLADGDLDAHVMVRAAMAHLHVVSIHPFADGNGRTARLTQSLVLARDGLLAPDFGSIEHFLAHNVGRYFAALRAVQGQHYDPKHSAASWVTFCIDAHIVQAERRLGLIEAAGRRWQILESIAEQRSWPDRFVIALEQTAMGGTTSQRYIDEADVSAATATADLRRLVDAGLLAVTGAGPSTRYEPTDQLRALIAP